MRIEKGRRLLAAAIVLLFLCGCAGPVPAAAEERGELAVAASFRQEDGAALQGGTVRCSFGGSSTDYLLDGSGELELRGLSRSGRITLAVLDRQERTRGGTTLLFSEGAVIDATTDEDGVSHISLKGDTEEVSLVFVLKSDGSLQCALRLARQAEPGLGAA